MKVHVLDISYIHHDNVFYYSCIRKGLGEATLKNKTFCAIFMVK